MAPLPKKPAPLPGGGTLSFRPEILQIPVKNRKRSYQKLGDKKDSIPLSPVLNGQNQVLVIAKKSLGVSFLKSLKSLKFVRTLSGS